MGGGGSWRELLLLGASGLACLAVLELSFRLFLPVPELEASPAPAAHTPRIHYVASAFSQHAIAAAPHVVDHVSGVTFRINAKGYRGEDFSWRKAPGTQRIVVCGGSAVFDIRQPEGEHWPARLERELHALGHRRAEVINAGVPAHASFDCVGRLLAEGHRLEPDLLLLYNAWNDIKYFRHEAPILRTVRAYRPEQDPLWTARGRLDAALAARLHSYRFLRVRFLLWDRQLGSEGARSRGAPRDAIEPSQVEQFRFNVEGFVDLARNAGARPVLLTQARLVSADNGPEQRERIAYEYVGLGHEALVEAFAATDRVLADVAGREGVGLVDAAVLSGEDALFRDHVHLSDAGSRALAQLVARELDPMLAAVSPGR